MKRSARPGGMFLRRFATGISSETSLASHQALVHARPLSYHSGEHESLLDEKTFNYCSSLQTTTSEGPQESVIDYTDISEEIDDSAAALEITGRMHLGRLNPKRVAVIANQYPAYQRSILAKSHYRSLGFPDIEVASGADANEENRRGTQIKMPSYALANEQVSRNALELQRGVIDSALQRGGSRSVVHMGHSVFTDIAKIIADDPKKFAYTTRAVVIQSGVLTDEKGMPKLDSSGFLQPDPTSFNNMCDPEAAKYMFEKTQEMGVPLIITTKHAADKGAVNKHYLTMLERTGHLFGHYMHEEAVAHMDKFWEAVQFDVGDPRRSKTLPPRLTRDWYLTNVATLKPGTPERKTMDERVAQQGASALNPWEYTKNIRLYDVQTAISLDYALYPEKEEEIFAPEVFEIGKAAHRVIGLSPEKHGIKDKEKWERHVFSLSEFALVNASHIERYGKGINLSQPYETYRSGYRTVATLSQAKGAFMEGRADNVVPGVQRHVVTCENARHTVYGVKKSDQETLDYTSVRLEILNEVDKPADTKFHQIIGDSAAFGNAGSVAESEAVKTFFAEHAKEGGVWLYGMTGHKEADGRLDTNEVVTQFIEQNPDAASRFVGNAVCKHTPLAIKAWGCKVSDSVPMMLLVHHEEGAEFGSDTPLSDNLTNGKVLLLEGGIQSFQQASYMLGQGLTVVGVANLRGDQNMATLHPETGEYVHYFSAAEFLNTVKEADRQKMATTGTHLSTTEMVALKDGYLLGHPFANPTRNDYGTKQAQFDKGFKQFLEERVWEKLDHYQGNVFDKGQIVPLTQTPVADQSQGANSKSYDEGKVQDIHQKRIQAERSQSSKERGF